MRKKALLIVSIFLCAALAAHAGAFSFSYTGTNITASGIFTGRSTSNAGVYQIAAVIGTRNGIAIAGLDPNNPFADQLLYFPATNTSTDLNPTHLDNNGIAFFVGTTGYNIFTGSTRPTVVENDLGPAIQLSASRTPAAVTPEPSTLALLGTGLVGAAAANRPRLSAANATRPLAATWEPLFPSLYVVYNALLSPTSPPRFV